MAAKSFLKRARRAAEAQKEPFWKRKTLAQMTKQEWESLCDGCGMCCVNKLEYEGTGELAQTDTCCKLLDPEDSPLPGLQEPQEDRAETASSSPQRLWPRWIGSPRPVGIGWSTLARTSTGGIP